ncbi:uncharacterized protein LOC121426047 [Lytechinus variegatus]|uniref:uncharacterized protein LOC121426047 n=1 Tax=Lytechinus variegatus TaxID=7654 RepID=UPI001BB186D8|nr:uncharacterized protein LOC121426047 [Lytechinus variegatus]
MPTSGESGIVPSSTYNLRSRPLPKTSCRPTTRSSNKENISSGKVTASTRSTRTTKKAEQSKIPVSSNSRIPVAKTTRSTASKTSGASSRTPTRRKVPDFEKLHKSWNKKFQQGKAVSKKPCTQTEAFDLTRPGTEFKRAYYDGTKKDVKSRWQTGFGFRPDHDDDFHVVDGALNDILNGQGLEGEDEEQRKVSSRATLAGTGVSTGPTSHLAGRRQTLGQLPSTGAGRVNNSSNILSDREISKPVSHGGKKSLTQEQTEAGITFETSADSLASILNNTGLHSSHKQHAIMGGRQTIGGMSAKQRQSARSNMTTGRTSIYYQKPKNHDVTKVYSEFAKRTLSRFTMDGNQASFKNDFINSLLPDNRGSIYFKPGNPAPEKPVTDRPKSSAAVSRTPGTAARVPNPRFKKQDQSCSPVLTPARRIPTTPGGQSQKNVRWADVLSSPTEGDIADQTKDVVAVLNFGDDCEDAVSPETKTRLEEVQKIEAETVLNRQKLNEMEEIEKQLELEIARLHEAGDQEDLEEPVCQPASSVPQPDPSLHRVDSITSNTLDQIPTKQPANYLDPVKLSTVYKADTAHVPTPENTTHGYSTVSEVGFQQHGTREVQHLQERVQRGLSHMQTSNLDRGFNHQHSDTAQPRESYFQSAVPSTGIDVKREPSSFPLSSDSHVVSTAADKPNVIKPEVTFHGVVREVDYVSDGSLRLQSPSGSRLMVTDSTEAFCGVFPPFLQNSYQSSRHPNQLSGQESAQGNTIMPEPSKVKTGLGDSINRLRVDMDHNHHHLIAARDNENKMLPTMLSYDRSKTTARTDPHGGRTIPQLYVPQSSIESTKPHISHDGPQAFSVPTKATAPTDNPRLTIHTPQPSRAVPRGNSFLNPTPHLRTMSTPLHHSSMMPTPIRTPLAMRHSSLTLSSGREHQVWPSPVASNAERFPLYDHNLPAPKSSNMDKLQQNYHQTATSCSHSSVETTSVAQRFLPYGNNLPAPRSSNMDRSQQNFHQTTTSCSHPEAAASSSIHPVGSLPNRPEHPVGSASTAFQYRRPHSASVSSECPRIASSQSSGAAGSLSLSDSLRGGHHREPVLPLKRQMMTERETSGQLFHQVLLDEECALYACRLKGRHTPESGEPRPLNPVGKVLMYGDDMHFVPIRDIEFLVASPVGSAFSNYYLAT